jgi:hypothetical protein
MSEQQAIISGNVDVGPRNHFLEAFERRIFLSRQQIVGNLPQDVQKELLTALGKEDVPYSQEIVKFNCLNCGNAAELSKLRDGRWVLGHSPVLDVCGPLIHHTNLRLVFEKYFELQKNGLPEYFQIPKVNTI